MDETALAILKEWMLKQHDETNRRLDAILEKIDKNIASDIEARRVCRSEIFKEIADVDTRVSNLNTDFRVAKGSVSAIAAFISVIVAGLGLLAQWKIGGR